MSNAHEDRELISKKDLLTKYGISYGALYRWKRKGLIPEEWFIKKATVTGQETFFPALPVCRRIEWILRQKEDISLDDLANQLNREAQRDRTLHLVTVFGEKAFHIKDIQSVRLDLGDGKTRDLTEEIQALIARYTDEEDADTEKEKPTWI